MTLDEKLQEIKAKAEIMIHWKEQAGQDVNESPYPAMLCLIEALIVCREQRNDEMMIAQYGPALDDYDAQLMAILEGK